jgi:hypothetical protein
MRRIRVAVHTTEVRPEQREAWCSANSPVGSSRHFPSETRADRLDLLDFPTILLHETGHSICTLRQASRRSWRIGQRRNLKVKFLHYAETVQENLPPTDGQETPRLAGNGR